MGIHTVKLTRHDWDLEWDEHSANKVRAFLRGMCPRTIDTKYLSLVTVPGKDGLLDLHEKAAKVVRIGGLRKLEGPRILETRRYGTEYGHSHLFVLLCMQNGVTKS